MSTLPLSDWDAVQFSDLQHTLARVLTQPTTTSLRRLYQQLDDARPWLLNLTLLPPQNDQDKQFIENNPLELPSGSSIHVTGDLLNTSNTVSTALSLSQLWSAVLALQSEAQRHQYPSRSTPEISVYLLHRWQTDLLDFLRDLFRVVLSDEEDLGQPFEQLKNFVDDLLISKVSLGAGKGDGTFIDQILSQLSSLQSSISSLLSTSSPSHPSSAGYELLTFRLTALRTSQNKLASLLALVAQGGRLGRGQVIRTLKWLKAWEGSDGMVGIVLGGLLSAWKPLEALGASDARYDVAEDWCHDTKFLKLASSLILQEQWTSQALREPLKLAWSLFYLSLLKHDPSVIQTGIDSHEMEGWLLDSIANGAFQYLHELVLGIRQQRGWEEEGQDRESIDELIKVAVGTVKDNDEFLFAQLRDLVNILAGKKQFLRNLRNKEEDSSSSHRRQSVSFPQTQNHNYQAYLRLLAVVYKSLPADCALDLWENTTFTSTVLDTRGGFPGLAFWEALASISQGQECARACYEKMKDTRLPWTALFKFYQHYIDIMPHIYESIKTSRTPSLEPMPADEVDVCRGWTEVLKTVVEWSPLARAALLQSKPQPVMVLFEFLNCDNVPLGLKSSILACITSFTRRTNDTIDDDVLSSTISSFEKITFRDPSLDCKYVLNGAKIGVPVGWLAKMAYQEDEQSSYPLSRAYVEFLTGLLPEPLSGPTSSRSRLANTLRRVTFHVLDGILLTLQSRRYARDAERWQVLDTITAFIEKSLLGFNMSELVGQGIGTGRGIGQVALELAEETGFVVMLRILSDQNVFAVLSNILDSAGGLAGPRPTIVNKVLLQTLRIYHRVQSLQLVFADVLLLTLSSPSHNTAFNFKIPYALQPLDNHLLSHLSNVNNIALLAGDEDSAISYVAVKIVKGLAESPVFNRSDVFRGEYQGAVNRLAGIVDASDDSIRIAQGFLRRLDVEGEEVEDIEKVEEQALLGSVKEVEEELPMLIRSTILDLLVDGTASDNSTPNLAHFLLGYDFRHRDFALQAGDSCLHVVLKQMLEGAELSGPTGDGIMERYPILGAKSAELIYQLFSHHLTGRATLGYAMSVTGYSARQLASLPRRCPQSASIIQIGLARYLDAEVSTTCPVLLAFLEYQRWVISSAALEIFSYSGHGASSSRIAQILFDSTAEESDVDDKLTQLPALLIDLLSSVDVEWVEPETENDNRQLEFYAHFDFDAHKSPDMEWWDLPSLSAGLVAFRKSLERQGAITAASIPSVEAEAGYVLQRLGGKNRETDVAVAKGNFLAAWNELLKVSLTMLFAHITADSQPQILFTLLSSLLGLLGTDLAPGVMNILCEAVLVVVTSLVKVLGDFEGVNLPVDLLSAVLARIVDAASKSGSTETARGNLYASITQYLQLITQTSILDDTRSVISMSQDTSTHSIQRATMATLSSRKERLIPILCRDAMDDRDVWKTECYALLSGIVGLCQGERDRGLLAGLMASGYLSLFVRSVKEREVGLMECLTPEAENLHAYWVFESKMSFLLALASTLSGAQDLLSSGLFEVFATCGFVNIPLTEEALEDAEDGGVVRTRQHRVVLSSLQLLARVLSSLGKEQRSGAGHALSFLNAHREAILALIREPQQNLTTIALEECRLVISILAMVVHKVPSEDLHTASSFGAFHLAALSAAAQSLDRNTWIEAAEEDSKIESQIVLLNQSILTYLSVSTTGLKAGSGNPVFITGVQRSHSSSIKYIASAPSLQMVVNYLTDLAEAIEEVSGEYEGYLERVIDGADLEREDIEKLRNDFIEDGVLTDELIKNAYVVKSQTLYNMVESLLLLIWRHLLFYTNDARITLAPLQPNNLSSSLGSFAVSQQAQMESSRSGAGTMKILERVAAGLKGSLVRLDDMEVNLELKRLTLNGSNGDAYYGMLVRRLKELVAGLVGEREVIEEERE